MLLYTGLMWAMALLFFIIGIAIHRGKTNLIHDYHQTKVKESEKRAYGRAFSKGIFGIALSLFLSGLVALLGESTPVVLGAVGVLFLGIVVFFGILLAVQRKYNQGLF